MANTHKNIVITPNMGSNISDPVIRFTGANSTTTANINLVVYPKSNGTLSFESSENGELFSIINSRDGLIFAVNDAQANSIIRANSDGTVYFNEYSGNTNFANTVKIYGVNNNDRIKIFDSQNLSVANAVSIRVPNVIPENYVFTLPENTGLNNQIFTSDGTGNTYWSNVVNITPIFDTTNIAFDQANTARDHANAAFDKANAALPNTTATLAGALTTTGQIFANSQITIYPTGTNEGGQLDLQGGTYDTKTIDSFNDDVRILTVSSNNNTLKVYNYGTGTFGLDVQSFAQVAGMNLVPTIQAAFAQANTSAIDIDSFARNTANAAFNKANTANITADYGYVQANTARTHANAAHLTANAAFERANTAKETADLGFSHANSAYAKANTANITADLAYGKANTANITADYGYVQANTARTHANTAHLTANAAYDQANTARDRANTANQTADLAFGQANTARNHANVAHLTANAAFDQANVSRTHANTAHLTANAAFDRANTANQTADLAYTHANNAYAKANTANITADLAFGKANTANITADYGYVQANTARDHANAAFTSSNTKLANTSGVTFNGDLNISGNLTAANLGVTNYFDLTPRANAEFKEGRLYYSSEEKTWIGYGDYADFEQTLGQREWVRCRNSTGSTIPKGKAVYITGVHIPGHPYHGHHPTIDLADASDVNKKDVIGVTGHDILDGDHGYVVVRGYIEGLNTSSLTSSSRVHLGYNGNIVDAAPEYPNWPMDIGICLTSNNTVGTLYVNLFDHSMERLRVQESARIGGDFTVEGNFTVLGSQSIVTTNSLQVGTQYVYMGYGDSIPNSSVNFTGTGLNDIDFQGHYTSNGNTTFYVVISDVSPDKFSWGYVADFSVLQQSNVTIQYQTAQLLSNGISIYFNANTGHTLGDKWNATAFGTSTDFGFIGNHIDGPNGYTHSGLFRDATDSTFKFFNSYDPEPNGNIDIGNTTFTLANLQVNRVTAAEVYEGAVKLSTSIASSYDVANQSFAQANTARNHANTAHLTANAAYDQANTARTHANTAHLTANAGFNQANTARTHANTAHLTANAGFNQANTARTHANSAYLTANAAFDKANSNNGIGNSSTSQVLFNDNGTSNGSINLTFDKTTSTLNVVNVNILGTTTYISANSVSIGDSQINSIILITSTATDQIADTFLTTLWRSAHYHVTMNAGTNYQTSQISVLHDGTNAYLTEYAKMFTSSSLGEFSVSVISGNVTFNVTPTNAVTTVRMFRSTNK